MIKINKSCKFNKRELKIGSKIELEHTKSKKVATRIAKQHICEFPNYYSKGLIPMETKLKGGKDGRK
jgi:hypothetical protein